MQHGFLHYLKAINAKPKLHTQSEKNVNFYGKTTAWQTCSLQCLHLENCRLMGFRFEFMELIILSANALWIRRLGTLVTGFAKKVQQIWIMCQNTGLVFSVLEKLTLLFWQLKKKFCYALCSSELVLVSKWLKKNKIHFNQYFVFIKSTWWVYL